MKKKDKCCMCLETTEYGMTNGGNKKSCLLEVCWWSCCLCCSEDSVAADE